MTAIELARRASSSGLRQRVAASRRREDETQLWRAGWLAAHDPQHDKHDQNDAKDAAETGAATASVGAISPAAAKDENIMIRRIVLMHGCRQMIVVAAG
jgi:hypothetical protein